MAVIQLKNPKELAEILCSMEEFDMHGWMQSQMESGEASYYRMSNGRVVEVVFQY